MQTTPPIGSRGCPFRVRALRRSAFTLIELLVVVAIITTLIGILLPALGQSREQARRVVCGTQLHQQGVMLHTYANEYKGRFPTEPTPNPNITGDNWPIGGLTLDQPFREPAGWALLAALGYAGSGEVFYCPSANRNIVDYEKNWHPRSDPDDWFQTVTEYAYWAGYRTEEGTPPNADLYELIARDARGKSFTLLSSDGIVWNNAQLNWHTYSNHTDERTTEPIGGNVLLLDSSVAWRGKDETQLRLIRAALQFWF